MTETMEDIPEHDLRHPKNPIRWTTPMLTRRINSYDIVALD
jgi:hypothetical protein